MKDKPARDILLNLFKNVTITSSTHATLQGCSAKVTVTFTSPKPYANGTSLPLTDLTTLPAKIAADIVSSKSNISRQG